MYLNKSREGGDFMDWKAVIKSAREARGFNQEELARLVGCARTTICDWERGKYMPEKGSNIQALEMALGLENGYLYSLLYPNPTRPPAGPGEVKGETA